MKFATDNIHNILYQGIKRAIDVTYDNQCFPACVILIYAAIDAMAYLGLPAGKNEVNSGDFEKWTDHYFRLVGDTQVSGHEWYSARCATVHTYGVHSRRTRQGARAICYLDSLPVGAVVDPQANILIVSINAMRKALSDGMDRFILDIFGDPVRRPEAERKLESMVKTVPLADRQSPPPTFPPAVGG